MQPGSNSSMLLAVNAIEFEPTMWYSTVSLLKSGERKWLEAYSTNLLQLLDFTIYGLNRVAAESLEVAADPYLYQTLGFVLTDLTRHRRLLLNYLERLTGSRPGPSKAVHEAYRNIVENSVDWGDFLAGCKTALRLLITASRAGIFYANDRALRLVLTAIVERDYEYNTYTDDFLGRYVRQPDVYQPSPQVLNVVLGLAMSHFPREGVNIAPPVRWVTVCNDDDLAKPQDLKMVVVDGWLEVLLIRFNGEVYAVENTCTHEGGWLSDGLFYPPHAISCIDHLAKFHLKTGAVLTQPHHGLARPLATFPAKVVDGKVMIGLYFE